MEELNVKEEVKTRLESWDLLTQELSTQIDTARNTLVPRLAEIAQDGDMVEEIYVLDNFAPVVEAALRDAKLPEDFVLPEGHTREVAEANFSEYCAIIPVRAVPFDDLSYPLEDNNFDQFVRLVTRGAKEKHFIDWWKNSIGFTEFLQRSKIPLMPTQAEMRLVYFTLTAMDCMARKQFESQMDANKIELATAGKR